MVKNVKTTNTHINTFNESEQEKTTPNIIIKLLKMNNKEKILKKLEEKIHFIQMNKLQMISCQKFCKIEDKVVTSLKF